MDYNTDREKLILPEYGRNVQNMVDYAISIEDRAMRQRCAVTIVRIMGQMFPAIKEMPDADEVLWNHLARMSRYELDIDYPVDIDKEEEAMAKPAPLPYPMTNIRYRHYGHLLESLLRKVADMEEGEERTALIELTANQMRKDLFYWNKDSLNDEKIAADIARYTDGKVQMDVRGDSRYDSPMAKMPRQTTSPNRRERSRK